MNLLQPSRGEVEAVSMPISDTFDFMTSKINAVWNVEHVATGVHTAITADSLTFRTPVTGAALAGIVLASGIPTVTTMGLYASGTQLFWNGFLLGTGAAANVSGSGTSGNLVQWNGTNAVTNGPAAANVPLLNAVNTFSAFGTHTWLAGSTGFNAVKVENTTSNGTSGALVRITAGTNNFDLWSYSQGYATGTYDRAAGAGVVGTGSGGLVLAASVEALRVFTGGVAAGNLRLTIGSTGLWTVDQDTTIGAHVWNSNSNALNRTQFANATSSTGAGTGLNFTAGTVNGYLDTFSQGYSDTSSSLSSSTRLYGDGSNGVSLHAADAAGTINFWTVASKRWGVNAAGDWTFGASSHIALGNGVPTIAGGFGAGPNPSLVGVSYGFTVTIGGNNPTTGSINLNRTYNTPPAVVCGTDIGVPAPPMIVSTSTIDFLGITAAGLTAGTQLTCLVLGY